MINAHLGNFNIYPLARFILGFSFNTRTYIGFKTLLSSLTQGFRDDIFDINVTPSIYFAFLVYMMVPVYLRLNILNHIAWTTVTIERHGKFMEM